MSYHTARQSEDKVEKQHAGKISLEIGLVKVRIPIGPSLRSKIYQVTCNFSLALCVVFVPLVGTTSAERVAQGWHARARFEGGGAQGIPG